MADSIPEKQIAALSLLAWAATASAECSWVMWSYGLGQGVDSYSIELARATRQDCLSEVRETAASMKARGYSVSGGAGSSEVIGQAGTNTQVLLPSRPWTRVKVMTNSNFVGYSMGRAPRLRRA